MSDEAVRNLARQAGVHVDWRDASGETKTVAIDSLRAILNALGFDSGSEAEISDSQCVLQDFQNPGDRRLVTAITGGWATAPNLQGQGVRLIGEGGNTIEPDMRGEGAQRQIRVPEAPGYYRVDGSELTFAVAPPRCWTVEDAAPGRRIWGAAAQLYSLRGRRAAPFGDFEALTDWARTLARHGADALAISPAHALFAADQGRYGPYAPSSRLFLNDLYAPVTRPLEAGDELIDWRRAGRDKLDALRAEFERSAERNDAITDEALARHALFEALSTHFYPTTHSPGWRGWPEAFHDPQGESVQTFAREHADEIAFHAWLQRRANAALTNAQTEARAAGMAVGLIADLAVGVDPDGSQVWSDRQSFLNGLSIGAPPDIFQPAGQDWGLTSFSPHTFRLSGWRGFTAGLSQALAAAGGVRIDHAMGLQRLWVTPSGASPRDGAYLDYPLTDMLRLIALESWRAKGIVVGEDLGTVPDGFREITTALGIYGMRVLWFEREADEAFLPPDRWSAQAMAMTSTHDLPTVAGWWSGNDIDWMERLNRRSRHADPAAERAAREEDRERLWRACEAAGVTQEPQPPPSDGQDVADAAVAYVAASSCELAIVPLEDLLGLEEQPNHPGTTDEAPNWRRRLTSDADTELASPRVSARIGVLNRARPSA